MIAAGATAFMPGMGIRKDFSYFRWYQPRSTKYSPGIESIFSLLEIMQFLSLFCLINTPYTPTALVSYYQSLGVATMEFLPNILNYIVPPSSDPTDDPDNWFDDNFRNHPSLSGKNFLFNIGNIITTVMFTVLFYFGLILGSKLWSRLEQTKVQYEHTVIYCTAGVTFLEIFLSACVQIKFVYHFS